jgi:hypothetical protein
MISSPNMVEVNGPAEDKTLPIVQQTAANQSNEDAAEAEFHPFPRLPIELRLKICRLTCSNLHVYLDWNDTILILSLGKHALPAARKLRISCPPGYPKRFYTSLPPPATLHADRESRSETLKYYTSIVDIKLSDKTTANYRLLNHFAPVQAPIYYRPQIDTICLDRFAVFVGIGAILTGASIGGKDSASKYLHGGPLEKVQLLGIDSDVAGFDGGFFHDNLTSRLSGERRGLEFFRSLEVLRFIICSKPPSRYWFANLVEIGELRQNLARFFQFERWENVLAISPDIKFVDKEVQDLEDGDERLIHGVNWV